MDCYDLIALVLKKEEVEWVACFPNNPLIEALAKQGIRPITFRHERGAVMAADGFSRTSDRKRFGIAVIQSQAGAENALGGIAQAFADNIPILVLPGGVDADLCRQARDQMWDTLAEYRPSMKRDDPSTWVPIMEEEQASYTRPADGGDPYFSGGGHRFHIRNGAEDLPVSYTHLTLPTKA